MPKGRKESQPRTSPYATRLSSKVPPPPKSPLPNKDTKQWDEARCPICLDHPHNAILLVCKSTTKGCIPYVCNTSKRHSNCLSQFKKTSKQNCEQTGKSYYPCPFCRSEIVNQVVRKNARDYLNGKVRSCSKESCRFSGTYRELRKHAMEKHPKDCPSEPDPERQSEWRRMEQRNDLGDLLSALGSSGSGFEGDGFTGIVRVPSMSLVLLVRVSGRSGRSEISIIGSDGDYDSNVNTIGDGGGEDEGSDEDYTFRNSRVQRRTRSWMVISDDEEMDGGDGGHGEDEGSDGDYAFRNSRVRRRTRSWMVISDDEEMGGGGGGGGGAEDEGSDEDYSFRNSRVRRRTRSWMVLSDDEEMDGGGEDEGSDEDYSFRNSRVRGRTRSWMVISDDEEMDGDAGSGGGGGDEGSDEDYPFRNSRVRRRTRSCMVISDDEEMDGNDGDQ